jgi:hypothetical protein
MRFILSVFICLMAAPVAAAPVVGAEHQRCESNADCTLTSLTCGNTCASVPVSLSGKAALVSNLRNECGGTLPEESSTICHMHPPLAAACINNRCTISYAFENHGEPADYQNRAADTGPHPQNGPQVEEKPE